LVSIESLRPLIIVPTFNEKENLEAMVAAIFSVVPFAELLVVDDGSPDGTGEIADRLTAGDERVHVLHRTSKEGLGKAYVAGFKWALERDYDRIIEMDCDFSHPPRYLVPMLETSLRSEVVVGSRYVPGGGTENWGLARRVISKGGGIYTRLVLGTHIMDPTAGFVCWRPEVLHMLPLDELHASGYGFQVELKYRAQRLGFTVEEFPIQFPDRLVGASKMSKRIVVEAILTVLKLRFSH